MLAPRQFIKSCCTIKKNQRQRYQMGKAATRMRSKIQQLVKDLHNKVASVLTNSYKLIFLPTYETSQNTYHYLSWDNLTQNLSAEKKTVSSLLIGQEII